MNVTQNLYYRFHWFHHDVINQKEKWGKAKILVKIWTVSGASGVWQLNISSRRKSSEKWFLRDFQSWEPFVSGVSFRRRRSDESLTDDYIIRHSWNVSLWVSGHSRICSSPLWSCSSRSVLPEGTGCDPVCVKAAPAQRLSSSDHWSPAPVAPVVLQLDSLLAFPDLWSAISAQSGFSQWSGWAQ